jgi:hypothetical protein
MNVYGSQRRLVGNAIAAMVAAIEIYNKPRFAYRNEVFTILLINAWELALKGVKRDQQLRRTRRDTNPRPRSSPWSTSCLALSAERCFFSC